VAALNAGGQIQIKKADGTVLSTVSVPQTGGWQTWQSVSTSFSLPEGNQTIRVVSTAAPSWNINWLDFTSGAATPPPPAAVVNHTPIPSKIEAEKYAAMSGVQVEATTDAGGGQSLGYIANGDWMEYSVNAPSAGAYTVNLRVASLGAGGQIQVRSATGSVLATVAVPNTNGWQTWQSVSTSVNLPQGNQTIRLVSTAAQGWNINWLEFATPSAPPPPAATVSSKIEAENYTAMSGVQAEATTDAGGGQNVGYIDNGDWMDYTINATVAASYAINLRVAAPNAGGQLQVRSATGSVLATLSVPQTGGYQVWQTITANISLAAGAQTIRVVSTAATNWNFNWLEVASASASLQAAQMGMAEVSGEASLSLFPNPVQDRFVIQVNNLLTGTMKVQIADMSGSIVKSLTLSKAQSGTIQNYISIGALAQGQYILTVEMDGFKESTKLVKL
jgi:hypothetical protein